MLPVLRRRLSRRETVRKDPAALWVLKTFEIRNPPFGIRNLGDQYTGPGSHGGPGAFSMRAGFAHLPLHGGKAPSWLFSRMTRLSREIVSHVVADPWPQEVLRRRSDPFWFQAFGCVLGFDWHSSGVTPTLCGAVKAGIRRLEKDLGLYSAG